jgi:2-polyprenyl-6-methoxyphenol hydroxylase-like FAD-dependent oxidoreductase
MNSTLPVLIIGAGPTGLALAAQLQRCGTPFRIIDPKPEVKQESRAFGIHCRTIEIFRQLGVLEKIKDKSRDMNFNMNIRHQGKPIAQYSLPDSVYPDSRPIMVPQYYTEIYLREHLSNLGIEIEQLEMVSFQQASDHIIATLKSPNSEDIKTIKCQYMVGCDGAHSVVRKQLGLEFPGMVRDRQWVLIDLEMDTDMHPTEGSIVWSKEVNLFCVPFGGFYRCIIDYGSLDEEVEVTEEKILEKLAYLAKPCYIKPKKVLWLSKFKINERMVPINHQGRVILCGDAAHIHSPAGGFGMNTGIQDAYHLGWMLTLMASNIVDHKKFIDIYCEERKLVWTKVLNVAGGSTNAVLTKASFLVDFFRFHILPILLKFSFLPRIIVTTGSGEYIKFPQSVLNHQPKYGWIPGYNNVVGERFKILPLQKVGSIKETQLQSILSGHYTFDILVYSKDLTNSQTEIEKFIEYMGDSDNLVNRVRSNNNLSHPLTSIKIISPNAKIISQIQENTPLQHLSNEDIYQDLNNKMKDLLPIDLTFSNAVFIVRPDGYIGKICSLSQLEEISSYFENIFL